MDEESQLQRVLLLKETELKHILEACAYIFEVSVYERLNPDSLSAHLEAMGLVEAQIAAFATVWGNEAAELAQHLSDATLTAPLELAGCDWRVHMRMAQVDLD